MGYDNYCYCKSKGIKGLLKYSGYEKKKKVNDKNRYQLRHMERQEDGTQYVQPDMYLR